MDFLWFNMHLINFDQFRLSIIKLSLMFCIAESTV